MSIRTGKGVHLGCRSRVQIAGTDLGSATLREGPRRLRDARTIQAAPRSWRTDEVYAERDLQRVAEVMKRMG